MYRDMLVEKAVLVLFVGCLASPVMAESLVLTYDPNDFIPGLTYDPNTGLGRVGFHTVRGVALSPDESRLYAAHWQAGIVASNDPIAVYSTTPPYPLLDVIGGGQCVGDVVTSDDGRYVYAPEYYGGYIHRYDTWNGNAKTSIDLGSWADHVWKTPDGQRIVVCYDAASGYPWSHHSLALVDISNGNFSVTATFNAGRPVADLSAAFSGDGRHMYLAGGSSETTGPTLMDIDLVGTFGLARPPLELAPGANQHWVLGGVVRSDGNLFVGDRTASKLYVVDEGTFTKIGEVALPDSPMNIALHPDGLHLFIMYWDGTLSVMDLSTLTEETALSGLNLGPIDAAFTADGMMVYIAHGDQVQGGVSPVHIIPEPATPALLALGGLGLIRRRRLKASNK